MAPRHLIPTLSLPLLPALANAADGATPGLGGSLLQLLSGFVLILVLVFATLWLLKRVSLPRGNAGNVIHVVSAAAVGPRERVVLVDIGERRLVLGVAPGRVALLDSQAIPAEVAQQRTAAAPAFTHWLEKTLARRHEN